MAETPKNKGNQNALKENVPATSKLIMRVTPSRKARYVKQAQAEGMKLTEWASKHLDAVCDRNSGDEKSEE